MKPICVVALGGNALLSSSQHTYAKQVENARLAMRQLKPLFSTYRIVITHGNGPQVGNILIKEEFSSKKVPHLPMDVAGAQTQGEIGYVLSQALSHLSNPPPFVSMITRTLVDTKDKAFKKPTKPIGPFYSTPSHFKKKKQTFVHTKKGYRRVVASPHPLGIVESATILDLLKRKYVVICCGGGGIPVIIKRNSYIGVEAVVDKDHASSCLAQELSASSLIILTDVDCVYINYGTKQQKKLERLGHKDAIKLLMQGEFGEGSMAPKVQAAIDFIESGGREVIITSLKKLSLALKEKAGTKIVR